MYDKILDKYYRKVNKERTSFNDQLNDLKEAKSKTLNCLRMKLYDSIFEKLSESYPTIAKVVKGDRFSIYYKEVRIDVTISKNDISYKIFEESNEKIYTENYFSYFNLVTDHIDSRENRINKINELKEKLEDTYNKAVNHLNDHLREGDKLSSRGDDITVITVRAKNGNNATYEIVPSDNELGFTLKLKHSYLVSIKDIEDEDQLKNIFKVLG